MTTEYVELRQQVREATQTVDWVREQLLVAKLPGQNVLLDWEADLTTVSQVLQKRLARPWTMQRSGAT